MLPMEYEGEQMWVMCVFENGYWGEVEINQS
jgi:hypothetical protein